MDDTRANPRFVSGHSSAAVPGMLDSYQGTAPQPCEECSIRIRAWLQPCHHNSDLDSGPAGHCEGHSFRGCARNPRFVSGHSFAAVRGMLDLYQGMASAMPPQLRSRFRPRRALRRAQLRSRARNARFVSGHGFAAVRGILDSYQGMASAMPPQLRSRLRPRRAMRRAQLRGCARNPRFVSGHGFSHATTTPISIEAPQGNAKGTASRLCEESSIRIRAWLQPCHHNSDLD